MAMAMAAITATEMHTTTATITALLLPPRPLARSLLAVCPLLPSGRAQHALQRRNKPLGGRIRVLPVLQVWKMWKACMHMSGCRCCTKQLAACATKCAQTSCASADMQTEHCLANLEQHSQRWLDGRT